MNYIDRFDKTKFYVIGIAMDDKKNILLINKNRPDWQKGLWNGIGGKIEEGETRLEAMKREAYEEANLPLDMEWQEIGAKIGTDDNGPYSCFVFKVKDPRVEDFISKTDEEVKLWKLRELSKIPTVDFLGIFIQWAYCGNKSYLTIEES